jgi:hypothetical protein
MSSQEYREYQTLADDQYRVICEKLSVLAGFGPESSDTYTSLTKLVSAYGQIQRNLGIATEQERTRR